MTDIYLILTVDTEEDQWGDYHALDYTTENIKGIPYFQELCETYHVRPTYLVSYVVSGDHFATGLLRSIHRSGNCEIGAHCHPWNTPPIEEERSAYTSMLCNLPSELQLLKLRELTRKIEEAMGIRPKCFRAGRWGFDSSVAYNLYNLGYSIDSSVSPYISWQKYSGPDFYSAPDQPYYFIPDFPLNVGSMEIDSKKLLEVPATVGFRQSNFNLASRAERFLSRNPLRSLRLRGILYKLGLLNKIWLSPELNTDKEMISLIKSCILRGYKFLNLTFHSTSLMDNAGPLLKSHEELIRRLNEVFKFCTRIGMKPITLGECLEYFRIDEN